MTALVERLLVDLDERDFFVFLFGQPTKPPPLRTHMLTMTSPRTLPILRRASSNNNSNNSAAATKRAFGARSSSRAAAAATTASPRFRSGLSLVAVVAAAAAATVSFFTVSTSQEDPAPAPPASGNADAFPPSPDPALFAQVPAQAATMSLLPFFSSTPASPPVAPRPADSSVADSPVDRARQILQHGFPGPKSDKLYNLAYAGAYDRRTRNAHWVAERLTRDSLKRPDENPPDRQKSHFRENMDVPEDFRTKSFDYVASGYDRGHLVPAADVAESQQAVDETFLMTNISPQLPQFNRGIWFSFEKFIRNLVFSFDEVFVVTGPLYLPKQEENGKYYVKYEVIGRDKTIAVPTHFFKIALGIKDGKSYLSGFVLPNEGTDRHVSVETFLTPVAAVERASGIDFFPNVDRRKAESICKVANCSASLAFRAIVKDVLELE